MLETRKVVSSRLHGLCGRKTTLKTRQKTSELVAVRTGRRTLALLFSRVPVPTPSSLGSRFPLHLLSGPGSHSIFSRVPVPTPSSLGSRFPLHLLSGPGSHSIFFRAPAPTLSARSNPRFSPSLHSVFLRNCEYSSLQFHFHIQQRNIPSNVIIMC